MRILRDTTRPPAASVQHPRRPLIDRPVAIILGVALGPLLLSATLAGCSRAWTAYLADFLLPGLRMEPYRIEQRIEKTWDGTAVVFGLQRLSWTQEGVRHRRTLRIVHVWTKRSGRWQVTHTQLTRVAE